MSADGFVHQLPDADPEETREWLESLDAVVDRAGTARAQYLLTRLLDRATERAVGLSAAISTPYVNTIPPEQEPWFPGDEYLERRIRAFVRWNAVAMVDRANHRFDGLGGHLSTYASAAALYEVGFNHFFHGKDDGAHGDQVFIQGHAAPGIYARAFLEGRLSEEQLESFRREVDGNGLPSYPHPRRLPEFWEFPTVSMGLSPLNAVAQARINRYLLHHELADTSQAKVWCFVGDGEMDEPEAKAGLSIAAREQLDNLIFVVNCNLQRLDGPVRGGGKIIQELEMAFRGAGWNVIKVIWGRGVGRAARGRRRRRARPQDERDRRRRLPEVRDRVRRVHPGALLRARPAPAQDGGAPLGRGPPEAAARRARLPQALRRVPRGDRAPGESHRHPRQDGEGMDARQLGGGAQRDPPGEEDDGGGVVEFRDRLYMDIPDDALGELAPYARPADDSPELAYLRARRNVLNGALPRRVATRRRSRRCPTRSGRSSRPGTGAKLTASTTTAFARLVRKLLADPNLGPRRRADHPGRGAHLRARRAVLGREDLLAVRADVGAGRRRACCCRTARRAPVGCSRRASPRPARWRRSPPPAPRTPRGASRWCRSSSSIRCSGSSASAI